ncbi:MAG: metallophosphoesterase [Candidatus Altiarchaeota archaeon]
MMGIIGDSHDNIDAVAKAVEFFNGRGVDLVVHTGDLVSMFTLEPLGKLKGELKMVFGNNEGERANIAKKVQELGGEIGELLEFEYDGRKVAVYHGQNPSLLDAIVKSKKYDIVATGHTHTPEVTMEDNTLIVNSGEACGYLTGVKTVALLDVNEMKADIHTLE